MYTCTFKLVFYIKTNGSFVYCMLFMYIQTLIPKSMHICHNIKTVFLKNECNKICYYFRNILSTDTYVCMYVSNIVKQYFYFCDLDVFLYID